MSASLPPSSDRPKRRLSTGLKVSLVVHACLLVALLAIPFRLWVAGKGGGGRDFAASSQDQDSRDAARADARSKDAAAPQEATRKEKVLTEKVEIELHSAIASAQVLPDDENLTRLDELGEKLNQVSNDKSLAELSQKFQGWLGTSPRAVAPVENPAAGEFDYETAQFHDIVREKLPEGGYRYRSVLLDAAGRTVEVETDGADGESTYNALALVKRNPLLEKVYRSITMPLLDKLTRAAERAGSQGLIPPAASESRKAEE